MHEVLSRIRGFRGDERFCVLARDDMEKIHRGSLEVLREVGCRIQHPRTLSLLREAGHEADEETGVVRFAGEAIEALIEKHRREETMEALPGKVRATIAGLTTRIYDPRTDAVRPSTKEDLEKACIIGEVLEEVGEVWPLFIPQDVPGPTCDLHEVQAMLTRTRKVSGFEIFREGSLAPVKEMLTIAAGSWEKARERFAPWYLSFISSPLTYTAEPLEIGFRAMELGYRVRFGLPMTVASATGPATFAGTLVISNAEALVGLVLSDMTGEEWVYGASPVILDPQTGATAYSGPDRAVLAATSWDFCRFYGVAPSAHVIHTDAVTPDFQAGFERGYAVFLQLLAGVAPGFACGLTGPGGTCGCLEQIVLDVECLKSVERMMKPIEVNDETMCLDLIKRVGIRGNFLAEAHTAEHFREAFWFGDLMKRVTCEAYNQERRSALRNATERVDDILSSHDPHPLSAEQEGRIAEVVAEAEDAARVG